MADPSDSPFDPGSLTPGQQATLEQYTMVTNQELKDAVLLLERSQWTVNVRSPPQ